MISYPSFPPIDAVETIVNAVRNGVAPVGQPGDRGCVVLACWNVLGYGLSLGVPDSHNVAMATGETLGILLEPLTRKTADGVTAPDFGKIPWAKIIPLVIQLLMTLMASPTPTA